MKPWYVDQGSKAWWDLRLGIQTASQFHRIITPVNLKYSKQNVDYKMELLAERLLQVPMGSRFKEEYAELGKIEQDLARRQFQFHNGVELKPIGFITTDDERMGCSPDALYPDGSQAVEIKCPNPADQLWFRYATEEEAKDWEAKYRLQVQGQLMIGQFERVHLYVYHQRLEAIHRKAEPDAKLQQVMRGHLDRFADELDALEERARREKVLVEAEPGKPVRVVMPDNRDVSILDAG